jgi:lactoylglutathione lyase
MKIDHIAIWTDNLENEKDFFLKYFNCTASLKYSNPLKRFSSYFITFEEGARIELMNREDISADSTGVTFGLAHFAVDLGSRENVDALTQLLERDGHFISSHPRVTGDGYYESVILDPEKNVIEIMSH